MFVSLQKVEFYFISKEERSFEKETKEPLGVKAVSERATNCDVAAQKRDTSTKTNLKILFYTFNSDVIKNL